MDVCVVERTGAGQRGMFRVNSLTLAAKLAKLANPVQRAAAGVDATRRAQGSRSGRPSMDAQ